MAGGARRPKGWAAGLAAAAAALAYAGLAIGSGLDRASETQPERVKAVPSLLASEALRSGGRAALAAGDARTALALGEAAVRDAPLDPASTALLGAGRYATGDRAGADRAFRIAAQLGWRIPYTQVYMMGRALEVQDFRVAALRFDALARQQPNVVLDRRIMDPLERDPRGRAALAERLGAAPSWLRAYTMNVRELPADIIAQRAAVLGEAARQGKAVGCFPVGPTVSALIANRAETDAARLWRAHCPGAAVALIYDGNFAAAMLDQTSSEFAWTFIGQSDVSVVLESDGAGRALAIDSSADGPLMVARQLLLVPPGTYRLSWTAQGSDGEPADGVLAAFGCSAAPREWKAAQLDPTSRRWSLAVSAEPGCRAQWLGLAAKGGASGIRLSDVRLTPQS